MLNLRDYLCEWLGCNSDCSECEAALADCQQKKDNLEFHFQKAQERIRQLELLVPRPTPPEIDYVVEKDTAWVQQVLNDMNLGIIRIPLDSKYYLTNRKNFLNIVAYDWVDSWEYIPDVGGLRQVVRSLQVPCKLDIQTK